MMTIIPDSPPASEAYGLEVIGGPLPGGTVWGYTGGGDGYADSPYLCLATRCCVVYIRSWFICAR